MRAGPGVPVLESLKAVTLAFRVSSQDTSLCAKRCRLSVLTYTLCIFLRLDSMGAHWFSTALWACNPQRLCHQGFPLAVHLPWYVSLKPIPNCFQALDECSVFQFPYTDTHLSQLHHRSARWLSLFLIYLDIFNKTQQFQITLGLWFKF